MNVIFESIPLFPTKKGRWEAAGCGSRTRAVARFHVHPGIRRTEVLHCSFQRQFGALDGLRLWELFSFSS